MISKLGHILAGLYIIFSSYLVATQGLFGESFIAIILGLPWSLGLSYFEYWNAEGALMYILILAPLALNTVVLYCIGKKLGTLFGSK